MRWLDQTILILLIVLPIVSICACESAWTEEPWIMNSLTAQGQNSSLPLPDLLPFNISGQEPQAFGLGSMEVPYSEYVSRIRSSELWIRDNTTWKQYIQAHQGDRIELAAYAPKKGRADLYRITYGKDVVSHKGYDLWPGYYSVEISADDVGRTMLILVLDSQPSAVIMDVQPSEQRPQNGPVDVKTALPGKAKVSIVSEKVKGYDVYVDGVFYSGDIADGIMDGIASFYLNGDRTYTITVSKRDVMGATYKNDYRRSFKGGYAYTLRI